MSLVLCGLCLGAKRWPSGVQTTEHTESIINFLLPMRQKVAEGRMRVRAWPGAWFMSKTNTVFIVKPVYDKWKDEPEYQALLKKANLVQP